MQVKPFDVIIVGAGPSGVACAIKLADTGLRVAILDKATFPRDKTCGDALSVDVVNQLSMLSPNLAAKFDALSKKMPSYGVKIFSPNRRYMDIPFIYKNQKSCGYICQRIDFDNLLFQHLKQYPTVETLENSAVEKVTATANGVRIQTAKAHFEAQMIIGADGAHSVVAKQLGNSKVERKHYSAGLRVYYEGVTSFHEDHYIELHFFKDILPGYLWIFPLPDNKANVGIGMPSSIIAKNKMNLKDTLQRLVKTHPQLKNRFQNARPLETIKGYGLPLGSKQRSISGERYLLTGDAASLIDPFSGEGIANAIRSGRIAAEHIVQCFEQQNFSAAFNKAYDEEIYRKMGQEFKINKILQKLVSYPLLFNLVLKKANQSKNLQQFFIEALASVEKKRKLLIRPGFYYRLLFKR